MEMVFSITQENVNKVKDLTSKNDLLSKQSISFKEGKTLNVEKETYLYISGSEESLKQAKKILSGLVKDVKGKELKKILEKIHEQEESAMQGFGEIFG